MRKMSKIKNEISKNTCGVCGGIGHSTRVCPTITAEDRRIQDKLIYKNLIDQNILQKNPKMKATSMILPVRVIKWIDNLVEHGYYLNRSEFIRTLVIQKLESKYQEEKPK